MPGRNLIFKINIKAETLVETSKKNDRRIFKKCIYCRFLAKRDIFNELYNQRAPFYDF